MNTFTGLIRPRPLFLSLSAVLVLSATLGFSTHPSGVVSQPASATTTQAPSTVGTTAETRSVATTGADIPTTPNAEPGPDARPNIVFISTDDQRADDMRWMPFTSKLIGGHGVTFTDALSPHPLCCPARAEFVTGQYGQNNGVHHNKGIHGGYPALLDPANTLARWLHDDGYQTAMAGKYLNGYNPDAFAQVGWDHWNPSVGGVYSYNHTTFYNDGAPRLHTEHVDDAVTRYAADYVREFAQNDAPFYVWASGLAPHGRISGHTYSPPLAAARHRGTMAQAKSPAHHRPSYGVPIVDGPRPLLTSNQLKRQDSLFRARIESLQAVDEGVRRIVRALEETGELDNTYIVFTTDNGYLLGEHGMSEKNYIFEEALRVPMLVRVPGQESGTTSNVTVTAVDIAPTVADLAGATPERTLDGVSFAPLLSGLDQPWRDTQLIQTGSISRSATDPGWEIRGVRTARWTYGRNMLSGMVELYDRINDPYEMVNLAYRDAYRPVVAELRARSEVLEVCSGETCQQTFGAVARPTRR